MSENENHNQLKVIVYFKTSVESIDVFMNFN